MNINICDKVAVNKEEQMKKVVDFMEQVEKQIKFRTMVAYKFVEMKAPKTIPETACAIDIEAIPDMKMYFRIKLGKIVVATVPMNNDKTEFAFDFSVCSPKDQFNRKMGQEKAKMRLIGRILGGSAHIFTVSPERSIKEQVADEVIKYLKNQQVSFLQGVTGLG